VELCSVGKYFQNREDRYRQKEYISNTHTTLLAVIVGQSYDTDNIELFRTPLLIWTSKQKVKSLIFNDINYDSDEVMNILLNNNKYLLFISTYLLLLRYN
jgi:hypothetical protein